MTRLWILSDLHLEAVPHPDAFDPSRPDFDVLVCAGDVWEGRTDLAFAHLRRLAGDKPVVFVMGNHEHWNGEVGENLTEARLHAEANDVTLLEGEETMIEGTRPDGTPFGPVRFVGSTLWSDYRLAGTGVDPRAETGEAVMVRHEDGEGGSTRLHQVTMELAAEMVAAGDVIAGTPPDDARERVDRALHSGDASETFARMVFALGGPSDFMDRTDDYLPAAPIIREVAAVEAGTVSETDARALGVAVVALGGGRTTPGANVDHAVGLSHLAPRGGMLAKGEPIARIHVRSEADADAAERAVRAAYTFGEFTRQPTIIARIGTDGGAAPSS